MPANRMNSILSGAIVGLALMLSGAEADELKDYGEYLSGECTSCHKLDGSGDGIPSIVGWEPDLFIGTMKLFKSGERENPAMVSVAKSLDDEQLKALAYFFGSLPEKH
jgi:cytochrome c553